jgi:5-methylcytosine-specific restriction protein A
MRVCSVPGCATLYPNTQGSRCPTHVRQADKARGTSAERGYNTPGHRKFRAAVLNRDPICTLCGIKQSTVADHYPHSRKELIALGLNPNDPQYGRGLDKQCHDRETAIHQPGGWNDTN